MDANKRVDRDIAQVTFFEELLSEGKWYPLPVTELDHFDTEHLVVDEFGEPCGENFLTEKL